MFLSTHCPTLLHTHRLMALKINYLLLSADPFVYISATGSILFWQLHLIDLGKEFGIFIRGRESPPGGEGSNVALYLAPSYSRKSN